MTVTTIKKNNILDVACNFTEVAKKEKWIPRYDAESDSFYLTVPRLPKDARIRYIGDEVAFYFTKDEKIKGIFIEYFTSNFLGHHKELRSLKKSLEELEKNVGDNDSLIKLNKKKLNKVIPEIEETLKMSILEKIVFPKEACACSH